MSVFSFLYERLFDVLSNDAGILALVPPSNIFPTQDAGEMVPGNGIVYSLQSSFWDVKRRRGTAELRVTAESVKNKVEANEIMDLVRAVLTARSLTTPGGGIVVHLFRELPLSNDDSLSSSGRYSSEATFRVLLIEEP